MSSLSIFSCPFCRVFNLLVASTTFVIMVLCISCWRRETMSNEICWYPSSSLKLVFHMLHSWSHNRSINPLVVRQRTVHSLGSLDRLICRILLFAGSSCIILLSCLDGRLCDVMVGWFEQLDWMMPKGTHKKLLRIVNLSFLIHISRPVWLLSRKET